MLCASTASAPVKAFDQKGESPFQARRYQPVVENGNCVSVRKGGEQPETNDQSVTKVNSIRPSLSGRILAIPEPLTVRRANPSILWISQWDRHGKPRRCSNGTKRSGRNGSMVVGDGMVRRSNEISREICQIPGRGRRTATKQWGTLLTQWPWPTKAYRPWKGNEPHDTGIVGGYDLAEVRAPIVATKPCSKTRRSEGV